MKTNQHVLELYCPEKTLDGQHNKKVDSSARAYGDEKNPCVFNVFRNGPLVKLNEFEQPNLRVFLFSMLLEKALEVKCFAHIVFSMHVEQFVFLDCIKSMIMAETSLKIFRLN